MEATTHESSPRLRVNREVIRVAREQAHLTPEEAVSRINKLLSRERQHAITMSDLADLETGTQLPTELQAEAVARVYLLPFVSLFQETPLRPPIIDLRRGAKGKVSPLSYDTLRQLNRFSRLYAVARRVSSALGMTEDVSIPERPLRRDAEMEDMEDLAEEIRAWIGVTYEEQQEWDNEEEALGRWTQELESLGVFVFSLPLPPDECRGASRWEPGGPPAILLSRADSAAGRLFTLVHEFGHLVFKTGERTAVCDPGRLAGTREEMFANRFAGATLAPRGLVLPLLPASIRSFNYRLWSDGDRRRLRKSLKVSQAVIGIRLVELGVVSESGYEWRPYTPRGRGGGAPVWRRFRRYFGTRALNLARHAVESELVTSTELSRILDIKVKDAEAIVSSASA